MTWGPERGHEPRSSGPCRELRGATRSFDDVLSQTGSTMLPDGSWKLSTVYAGQGDASDCAGLNVQGKVAVVRHRSLKSRCCR